MTTFASVPERGEVKQLNTKQYEYTYIKNLQ